MIQPLEQRMLLAGEALETMVRLPDGFIGQGRRRSGQSVVEVVGEVALVLRRKAGADVVAVHPTVTLHLPREDFVSLIKDHPAILRSLYISAVQRDEETSAVIANSTTRVTDDYILV